jgi:hypothetical protein
MRLGELDLEAAAKQAAGNWQHFSCFCWDRERVLDDPEHWAIIYTHNRDSGITDLSNADAIEKLLRRFARRAHPDVVFESHDHWAVGHVDGFSIRVFTKRGRITKAFQEYHRLVQALADYPILDEEDHSRRELEASLDGIEDAAWRLKRDYDLPVDWVSQVHEWFDDHDQAAIANRDDQGGYPTEEQLKAAFQTLGYHKTEEDAA